MPDLSHQILSEHAAMVRQQTGIECLLVPTTSPEPRHRGMWDIFVGGPDGMRVPTLRHSEAWHVLVAVWATHAWLVRDDGK